jgi:hypothetical protein
VLTFLLVLMALPVGGYLGWHAGTRYYEWTAGPDAQYGYEFEGMVENLMGAVIGALLLAAVVAVVRALQARSRRR